MQSSGKMCIGILLFLFLSPFSLTSRNLVVESDPVGADVYVQGTRAGKTPLTFPLDQKTLKQSEGIRVSITYPGYTPFDTKLSPDTATDCWYVCAGLLPIGTPGPVSSKGVRQISLSTNFTQGALNGYSITPGQTMAFHTKIKTGRVQATALLYQTNLVFIVDNMDKNIELDFPTRPVDFHTAGLRFFDFHPKQNDSKNHKQTQYRICANQHQGSDFSWQQDGVSRTYWKRIYHPARERKRTTYSRYQCIEELHVFGIGARIWTRILCELAPRKQWINHILGSGDLS